jgi:thiamine-phosphate pyrophosphorylase
LEERRTNVNRPDIDFTLYLVTDRRWLGGRALPDCVEEAILGGATVIQLREKEISSREYLELAAAIKAVAGKHGIPLIINDRVDIALASGAGGVHLGPDDMPVGDARRLLGADKIIGASAASVEEALLYERQGADYLGVGAVFPTATKSGTESVSLKELAAVKSAVRIPVVAIGGITEANAPAVMAAGADGAAVVSAIMNTQDIRDAARRLSLALKGAGQ